MQSQRMVPFKILRMDSLGQGVSKETDKITFIGKTLPGDAGDARIVAERKGVSFAKLESLKEVSPMRVKPVCPHFDVCPSCHYLHTPYENELAFKKESLEQLFKKIPHPDIQVTPGVRRTHYRNRIQLHYDLAQKKMGMLDAKDQSIAPIPQCLIGRDAVLDKIKDYYFNGTWMRLAEGQPQKGHVEFYELNEEVQVSWNEPYSQGGFTQVFDEMNQILKTKLQDWANQYPAFELLDLFAGNGNLSDKLNYSKRLCIDMYPKSRGEGFLSQDLYDEKAFFTVRKKVAGLGLNPGVIVLDPPRSGLKNLEQWLEEYRPAHVAYVSCDPHTMVRDLMPLQRYQITQLHLIDFFPSTFHFETMAFLERK